MNPSPSIAAKVEQRLAIRQANISYMENTLWCALSLVLVGIMVGLLIHNWKEWAYYIHIGLNGRNVYATHHNLVLHLRQRERLEIQYHNTYGHPSDYCTSLSPVLHKAQAFLKRISSTYK